MLVTVITVLPELYISIVDRQSIFVHAGQVRELRDNGAIKVEHLGRRCVYRGVWIYEYIQVLILHVLMNVHDMRMRI